MDIGKRIKARRKELGLSAEEVAERMGVSAATVYRYESNYISNMGIDKLTPIATALKTSEAYLMGWTTDRTEVDSSSDLTDIEHQLLNHYRQLNPEGQSKASDYLDDLVASGKYAVADNVSAFGDGPISIAAHERTDIEVTDEMREHDLAIMMDDDF